MENFSLLQIWFFKENIYVAIAEGKGIKCFDLATIELQFDCSATKLRVCSNQILNQAKCISSAVTISGSIHNSLSPKPLPALTVLLKWCGELRWGHCGGAISRWTLLLLQMQLSVTVVSKKMHQAHPNRDQLPGGTDVTRPFYSKQSQLWGQIKLSGVLSLRLLKNTQGQSLSKFSVQPALMLMQTCPGIGWLNCFLCTVRHYWAAKTTKGQWRILV